LISHNQLIKQFADYTPTSTYYREYYAHLEAADFDVVKLAQTDWFRKNHYKVPEQKGENQDIPGMVSVDR